MSHSGFQNEQGNCTRRVSTVPTAFLANPGLALLPIGRSIQPEELKNYCYHDDHADYIEDIVAHIFLPNVYCAYQCFRQAIGHVISHHRLHGKKL